MRQLCIVIIVIMSNLCLVSPAQSKLNNSPRTFPSLPTQYRETKFKEVQDAFEERSRLFLQGRQFHYWEMNRPTEDIFKEFDNIHEWRHHTWYSEANSKAVISRPDFMVAQDLLEKGYYKRPNLIAFQYNQTDGSYNSSTVFLNGQRFLAMEAPMNEQLSQNFFKLLQNFQVTQLVRLTPAFEKGIFKSEAYWKNRVKVDPKTSETFLNAPFVGSKETYPIRYYALENWKDLQGIDPKILLTLIQKVRKHYDPTQGLLACHCSGGVGRTGTFLAGFALIQDIDRQLSANIPLNKIDISIEKVVLQLSLQRFYMVSRKEQYLTLYRLVDLYMQTLQNKK